MPRMVDAPGTVHVTADYAYWWNGNQWLPAPWPGGLRAVAPWWDGAQWRWDTVSATPSARDVTPGQFALMFGMAGFGFVVGILGALDPNVPGNNPLPGGLIGLVVGFLLAAFVVAGARSVRERSRHRIR